MVESSLISVIMPTYNRSSLIPRSINSVFAQSYENWELIIVDDGSTDNTKQIIESYLRNPKVRYIYKNNSGAAASRNQGVEAAQGDYILFLDSDDEIKTDLLREFNSTIIHKNLGIAFCGFERWNEEKLLDIRLPKNLGPIFDNVVGSFVAGSFVIRKECFIKVGGYDLSQKSGQHTELFMRLIPYCLNNFYEFKAISKAHLKIHIHDGERIRTNNRAVYLGTKQILEKHGSLLNRSKIDESNYLKIAGYNAFALGLKKEALALYYKSFKINPNMKSLLRLINYKIKSYT